MDRAHDEPGAADHRRRAGWRRASPARRPLKRGTNGPATDGTAGAADNDNKHAIDATKIHKDLGWKPAEDFASGIKKTVRWYLDNQTWVGNVTSGAYRQWVAKQYQ